MKERAYCTRCKGNGRYMPHHGITKADMKDCDICKGTGERQQPKTSRYVKNTKCNHITRYEDMHLLEGIEAV